MNFEQLPHETILTFLRETGFALLQQAVTRELLTITLTDAERDWFLSSRRSRLRRWRDVYGGMRLRQIVWTWLLDGARRIGIRATQPPSLSIEGSTQLAVVGTLPLATWRTRVNRQVEQEMGAVSLGDIPFKLWGWLGTLAWQDPAFQHETTEWVEKFLHENALFALGERPKVTIAPQTYWLLIGLACSQEIEPPFESRLVAWLAERRWGQPLARFGAWFGRKIQALFRRLRPNQPYFRALHNLNTISNQYGLHNGWGSVWDRWILLEALHHWSGDTQHSDLYLTIHALHEKSPLTKPDWQRAVPNWFDDWWQNRN